MGATERPEDREIRYYATLACQEVRAQPLVSALVTRIFDPDYGVHTAAIESLQNLGAKDIDAALEPARKGLTADVAKARAAAHALGELHDVKSVAALIDVLERDARDAQAAVQLVMAQTSISSQMIDNLNASIHLRSLLTDLFLVDELIKSHQTRRSVAS